MEQTASPAGLFNERMIALFPHPSLSEIDLGELEGRYVCLQRGQTTNHRDAGERGGDYLSSFRRYLRSTIEPGN
jgi:hypothetical protein